MKKTISFFFLLFTTLLSSAQDYTVLFGGVVAEPYTEDVYIFTDLTGNPDVSGLSDYDLETTEAVTVTRTGGTTFKLNQIDINVDGGTGVRFQAFLSSVQQGSDFDVTSTTGSETTALPTDFENVDEIRITNLGGGFSVFLDNADFDAAVACTAPTAQATLTVFGTKTSGTLELNSWTAPVGGATGYAVYMNSTNSFTEPSDGDEPTADLSWSDAGQQPIYFGTSASPNLIVTGLTLSTTYYFQIYAYNDCAGVETYEATGLNANDVTAASGGGTFDFESFSSTPAVSQSETVGGVTTTVTMSNGDAIFGSSGPLGQAATNNFSVTDAETLDLSFNVPIGITSITLIEFATRDDGDNWVLTPNVGTPLTIADDDALLGDGFEALIPSDWDGVSTVSVGYDGTAASMNPGVDNIVFTISAPTMQSAIQDNSTQITVTYSENVQTNETNPTDFTVTDGGGAAYAVSAQADGTPNDTDIILTVADMSAALGDITITYTNINNEISDAASGTRFVATDATGVVIDLDNTPPELASASVNSSTEIYVFFDEDVQDNSNTASDFIVTDGIGETYTVSAIADAVAQNTRLELTVADVSGAVGDLTVTYSNTGGSIDDFGSNSLADDGTGVVIDTDNTAPTMQSAADVTNTRIDVTFDDAVQINAATAGDFTIVDGLGTGFTVSALADGTANDAIIQLTVADFSGAVGDLTVTYSNTSGTIDDFGGNSLANDASGVVVDFDAADPILSSAINVGNTQIDITFNEEVQISAATAGDFTVVDGVGTGFAVSALADGTSEDTDIELTVANFSTAVGDLTVTYSFSSGTIDDFGGNSLANDATGVDVDLDNAAPELASATVNSNTEIYIFFDEEVQNNSNTASDFIVTDGVGDTYTVSAISDAVAQNTRLELTVADVSGAVGDLTVTYANTGGSIDDFGNNSLADDGTGVVIDTDTTIPQVSTIARQTPSTNLTNQTSVTFRVTFNEPVQNVNTTDFEILTGGKATGSISSVTPNSTTQYDVLVGSVAEGGDDELDLDFAAGQNITDFGGNSFAGSIISEETYDIDQTPPTVTDLEIFDADDDGYIDRIDITFSENIDTDDAASPVFADLGTLTLPDGSTVVTTNATPSITDTDGTFSVVSVTGISPLDHLVGENTSAGSTSIDGLTGLWEDNAGNAILAAGDDAETVTDSANPILLSSSPTDNSASFIPTNDFNFIFSEDIQLGASGTRTITLNNITGASTVETFDLTTAPSGLITIGTNSITINPTSDLSLGNEYAIQISTDAIDDQATPLNSYIGINNNDDLDFIADNTAPIECGFDYGTDYNVAAGSDNGHLAPSQCNTDPAAISSLVNSQATAVSVFHFHLMNGSTGAEDVNSIVFRRDATDNIDWSVALAGAVLIDENGVFELADAITSNSITFSPNTGNGDLGDLPADNSSSDGTSPGKEYALRIWFNTNLGVEAADIDGKDLMFTLSTNDMSGVDRVLSGASYADISTLDITSSVTVNVVATNYAFLQQPTDVDASAFMSPVITLEAIDVNGNRDLGYNVSDAVQITSTGTLSGLYPTPTVSTAWVSGVGTVSDIVHNVAQAGRTLGTTGGALTDAPVSSNFEVTADNTAPTFLNAHFFDTDGNGDVDEIVLEMSEVIDQSTASVGDFTLTNGTIDASILSGPAVNTLDANDADQYFTLQVSFSGTGTSNLEYTQGTLADPATNLVASIASINTNDLATPVFVAAHFFDAETINGSIDEVVIEVSENVDDASIAVGDFLVNGAGVTLDGSISNSLDPGSPNDQYFTFVVAITGTGTSIASYTVGSLADNSSNNNMAASDASIDESDQASPFIINSISLDRNLDGNADAIELEFSESIKDISFSTSIADWEVSSDNFVSGMQEDAVSFSSSVTSLASDTDFDDQYVSLEWTPTNTSGTDVFHINYVNGGNDITDNSINANAIADLANFVTTDGANAVLITNATWNDVTSDGDIDQVILTFNEAVNITDGNAGDGFPAISINGGLTIDNTDYASSGVTELTLNFTGDQISGTGISGLTVQYVSGGNNINGVVSATEMANGTAPISSTDGADPIANTISIISSNTTNTDYAITSNTVTLSFVIEDDITADPNVVFRSGGALVNNAVSIDDSGAPTYEASYLVSSLDTDGPVTFTIDYSDDAGNAGTQITVVSNASSVITDNTAPTVTISRDPVTLGDFDGTTDDAVSYSIVFDAALEPTSISEADDINESSAGLTVTPNLTTSDNIDYTLSYTAISGNGDLSFTLINNGATPITDLAGNALVASSVSNTISFDNVTPSITNITREDSNPTNANSVTFRVEFDNSIDASTLTSADFSTSGTAAGGASISGTIVEDVSGLEYLVEVSGISGDGTLELEFDGSASSGISDDAGNNYTAIFNTGEEYSIDNTAPTASNVTLLSNGSTGAQIGDPVTLTFTVDDDLTGVPVVTFQSGGGNINNSVAVAVDGAHPDYMAQYIVSSLDNDGLVTFTLDFIDDAGNAATQIVSVSGTGSTSSVTVDAIAPTLVITRNNPAAGSIDQTNSNSLSFDLAFSEVMGSGFDFNDIDLNRIGVTTDALVIADLTNDGGGNYTLVVSNISGDGTLGITVTSAGSPDPAGNTLTSDVVSELFTIDNTAPTATITRNAVTNGSFTGTKDASVSFDIFFSTVIDNTTFAVGDIIVTNPGGVALGTAVLTPDGDNQNYTYSLPITSGAGDLSINLPINAIEDGATNGLNPASTSSIITIDNAAPLSSNVTISSSNAKNSNQAITGDIVSLTFTVDDDLTGTPIATFRSGGSNINNPVTVGVNGAHPNYIATYAVSSLDSDGAVTFTLNFTDDAGNESAQVTTVSGTGSTTNVDVDNSVPTVTITRNAVTNGSFTETNDGTISFDIAFSEDIDNDASEFTLADDITVNLGGTTTAPTQNLSVDVATSDYTLTLSGITGDGDISFDLLNTNGITDLAGNILAATVISDDITIDNTAPIATITRNTVTNGSFTGTKDGSISFDISFNTAIDNSTFSVGDVTIINPGSIVTGVAALTPDGDNQNYTYTIPITSGNGDISISLAAGVIADAATNQNPVANSSTITIDNTAPSSSNVTLFSSNLTNTNQAITTNTVSLTFTVNDDLTGIPAVEFKSGGANINNAVTVGVNGAHPNYIASYVVSALDGDGNVTFTINFTDDAENDAAQVTAVSGTGSTTSVNVDNTAPTVIITRIGVTSGSFSATNAGSVSYDIAFSEDIDNDASEFTLADDLSISLGGTVVATSALIQDVATSDYTVNLSTITGDGDISITVLNTNGITDLAGNALSATVVSDIITMDNTAPEATITRNAVSNGSFAGTNDASISFDITFSTAIDNSTFVVGDLTVNNPGAVITGVGVLTADGNNQDYTYTLPISSGNGDISITLAAGAISDAASNGNPVETSDIISIDNIVPVLTALTINSNNTLSTERAKDGDIVTLTMDFNDDLLGNPSVAITSGGINIVNSFVLSEIDAANDIWTAVYTVNASDRDGDINFTVDFTDNAGNQGIQATNADLSSGNTVEVDNTAPVVTVTFQETNDTTPLITGTVSDNNTTISSLTMDVAGQTFTLSNFSGVPGSWSLDIGSEGAAIANGIYDVTVVATDNFGNQTTDATAVELEIGGIVLTAANALTDICVDGDALSLGDIILSESKVNDFRSGNSRTLFIETPTNFEYNSNVAPVFASSTLSDITSVTSTFVSATTLRISINNDGTDDGLDTIRIVGLEIKATTGATSASNMLISLGSAAPFNLSNGAITGSLVSVDAPVAPNVMTGSSTGTVITESQISIGSTMFTLFTDGSGTSYNWYDNAGNLLHVGASATMGDLGANGIPTGFDINTPGLYSIYVGEENAAGCESVLTQVNIYVYNVGLNPVGQMTFVSTNTSGSLIEIFNDFDDYTGQFSGVGLTGLENVVDTAKATFLPSSAGPSPTTPVVLPHEVTFSVTNKTTEEEYDFVISYTVIDATSIFVGDFKNEYCEEDDIESGIDVDVSLIGSGFSFYSLRVVDLDGNFVSSTDDGLSGTVQNPIGWIFNPSELAVAEYKIVRWIVPTGFTDAFADGEIFGREDLIVSSVPVASIKTTTDIEYVCEDEGNVEMEAFLDGTRQVIIDEYEVSIDGFVTSWTVSGSNFITKDPLDTVTNGSVGIPNDYPLGVYTIRYTSDSNDDDNGCTDIADDIQITVLPKPEVTLLDLPGNILSDHGDLDSDGTYTFEYAEDERFDGLSVSVGTNQNVRWYRNATLSDQISTSDATGATITAFDLFGSTIVAQGGEDENFYYVLNDNNDLGGGCASDAVEIRFIAYPTPNRPVVDETSISVSSSGNGQYEFNYCVDDGAAAVIDDIVLDPSNALATLGEDYYNLYSLTSNGSDTTLLARKIESQTIVISDYLSDMSVAILQDTFLIERVEFDNTQDGTFPTEEFSGVRSDYTQVIINVWDTPNAPVQSEFTDNPNLDGGVVTYYMCQGDEIPDISIASDELNLNDFLYEWYESSDLINTISVNDSQGDRLVESDLTDEDFNFSVNSPGTYTMYVRLSGNVRNDASFSGCTSGLTQVDLVVFSTADDPLITAQDPSSEPLPNQQFVYCVDINDGLPEETNFYASVNYAVSATINTTNEINWFRANEAGDAIANSNALGTTLDDQAITATELGISGIVSGTINFAVVHTSDLVVGFDGHLGCNSQTIFFSVIISPFPDPQFGFDGIVQGETTTFSFFDPNNTDIASGGLTFSVTGPSGAGVTHTSDDLSSFDHTFDVPGDYTATMTITTENGCSFDRIRSFRILPKVVVNGPTEYDFNTLDEGWFAEFQSIDGLNGDIDNPANTSSWELGTPDSNQDIINSDAENDDGEIGGRAWVTNLDGNYLNAEESFLYSPGYDLDGLSSPAVQFSTIRNLDGNKDGVVFQLSLDNGSSWTTVGNFDGNESTGVEWYNANTISATPGDNKPSIEGGITNYNPNRVGWSDSDVNPVWVTSIHPLNFSDTDDLSNVRFRFALNAIDANKSKEGFGFDNFTLYELGKTVLLEQFSSTISDDSKAFQDAILSVIDRDDVMYINYMTDFANAESNDVLNERNPSGPGARAEYYEVSNEPHSVIDGEVFEQTQRLDWGVSDINLKELSTVLFNIENLVINSVEDNTIDASVDFVADFNDTDVDLSFFFAVVETSVLVNDITGNDQTNVGAFEPGDSILNVLRVLNPSPAGNNYSGEVVENQVFSYSMNWEVTNVYDVDKLRIIVFVQSNENVSVENPNDDDYTGRVEREVLQSAYIDVTGLDGNALGIVDIISSFNIYPNPGDKEVTVLFDEVTEVEGEWIVYDQTGREVLKGLADRGTKQLTIVTKDIPSGIYLFHMYGEDNSRYAKRLIIMH